MPWVTKEGRTVEEARTAAVSESGLPEADLDIEVVNEGARGLFGLGGEPAVVRVRPKNEATDFRDAFRDDITPARDETTSREPRPVRARAPERDERDDERDERDDDLEEIDDEDGATRAERQQAAADLGVEIVRGIIERLELEGEVKTRIAGGTVYIEIFGEEMGILIGRSGTTLEALQEIVRAGIQRRLKTRQAVVVDVEGYWDRRRKPERSPKGRPEGESGGGGRGRGRGGRGRRGGGRGRGRGGRGGGQQADLDPNLKDPEPEESDGDQ